VRPPASSPKHQAQRKTHLHAVAILFCQQLHQLNAEHYPATVSHSEFHPPKFRFGNLLTWKPAIAGSVSGSRAGRVKSSWTRMPFAGEIAALWRILQTEGASGVLEVAGTVARRQRAAICGIFNTTETTVVQPDNMKGPECTFCLLLWIRHCLLVFQVSRPLLLGALGLQV